MTTLRRVLPGDRTVRFRDLAVLGPGHGLVLVRMKASSICRSDLSLLICACLFLR